MIERISLKRTKIEPPNPKQEFNLRHWGLSIITSFLLLGFSPAKPALADIQVLETHVDFLFEDHIEFLINIKSDVPVEKAILFIRPEGDLDTISETLEQQLPSGETLLEFKIWDFPIRAFSTIEYWVEITPQEGDLYTSPMYTFYYEDNRYNWQTREAPPFRVHWYEGDAAFAQNILDVAMSGMQRVQDLLPLSPPDHVDIYVYASALEMRTTLQMSGLNWVGAHSSPDLNVMVLSLPAGPEQRLEMERQIPHELMHIMLYENIGMAYGNLPVWLNEGLSSVAELYPNTDYLILLDNAREQKTLLPISSLCHTFPRDASSAYKAYAQATSFTRFLHKQYGSSGIQELVNNYADGLGCDQGAQVTLGSSLTQLENQWRREVFGEAVVLTALMKLLPWIAIMVAVLGIMLGLTIRELRRKPVSSEKEKIRQN